MNRLSSFTLIVFGTFWGLWYFGMGAIGWGDPGSAEYQRYELYNRLLPLVLLPLLWAVLASRRGLPRWSVPSRHFSIPVVAAGLVVMTAGSAIEFWLFTLAPYADGSLRSAGWMTYCAGLLLFFVGTASLGTAVRRRLPVAAALLALWLPAGAALAAANATLGTAAPPLSIAVALCGAGLLLYGVAAARSTAPAVSPDCDRAELPETGRS